MTDLATETTAAARVLPLAGLTVIVTGDVPGLTRASAVEAVGALGGRSVSAVSGKVDLVVAGDGAGVSKMDKARRLGCRVLTGTAFAALVAAPSTWDGTTLGVSHAEWERGLTATDEPDDSPDGYGAEQRWPRPGDPDYVPMSERHLVSLATDHVRIGKEWRRRFRLRCGGCGHVWQERIQHHHKVRCPVGEGLVDEVNLVAPWSLPDKGWFEPPFAPKGPGDVIAVTPAKRTPAPAAPAPAAPAPVAPAPVAPAPVESEPLWDDEPLDDLHGARDADWTSDWDEPVPVAPAVPPAEPMAVPHYLEDWLSG